MASGGLKTCDCKRDFDVTAEASSQSGARPSKALRFVIQKRVSTRLHYELWLDGGFGGGASFDTRPAAATQDDDDLGSFPCPSS